ncbi:MAG TPA: retropepsin-like aspartic protease [Leptolyngbyaceae cyanobacterium]
MYRTYPIPTLTILLSGILVIAAVGCSNDRSTSSLSSNAQPSITASPSTPIANTSISESKSPLVNQTKENSSVSSQSDLNNYQQALVKAASAISITESARSSEDWQIVIGKWEQAIDLLKAIPASSTNYSNAKAKLAEYQRQLDYARQQANPNSGRAFSPAKCLNKSDKSSSVASGKVFRVPIKRRVAGTVVVDVTFFNSGLQQTYEMILDTGASGTVITPPMASALRTKPIGSVRADTASGQGVTFAIACIDSIQAGGAVHKNIPVAIGSALNVGLLGQNFFGDYDITIKSNVVEFQHR